MSDVSVTLILWQLKVDC